MTNGGKMMMSLKDVKMKQEGICMYVTNTESDMRGLLKDSAGHGTREAM